MSTGSPTHSLCTRPLSAHPVRPRLYSAISNGSLFAGYMLANPRETGVVEFLEAIRDGKLDKVSSRFISLIKAEI